jgi:putative transposase
MATRRVPSGAVSRPLVAYDLEAMRIHLNNGCALGSSKFQDEIEAMVGRRAKIVPQRRPRKPKDGGEK